MGKLSIVKIKIVLLSLCISAFSTLKGQNQGPYFVDGYHGGIYGHYPLWVTQFMLDKLKLHPEWQLGLEIEPETWDTVKLKDPAGYMELQKWVRNKRIDFTNPTYAQPYMYNISGESIIRQFSYGMAKQAEHFDGLTYTTYAVEEPCFTSSLPQILNQFGFKYAVLKCPNTCWGGYTRAYGGEVLNWIGSDGTSILTAPRYQTEALEENSTWQTTAWINSSDYLNSSYAAGIENPVGMTYQDAGWKNGPWLGTGNKIKASSQYITWTNYFDNVAAKSSTDNWHLNQEDLLVNLMWGSQVLQKIGQQVRRAENRIIQAEKIAGMAYLEAGHKVDQSLLDEAWRTLMMAQHHDSWIVPYNKLKNNQTWAQIIAHWTDNTVKNSNHIIDGVNKFFASKSRKNEYSDGFIRVYNTLLTKRTEAVEVILPRHIDKVDVIDINKGKVKCIINKTGDENILQFEASVDGYGYSTYALVPKIINNNNINQGISFDELGNCYIENDMYKIVLNKEEGGTVKSLIAKDINNREFSGNKGGFLMGEISGHFYEEAKFHSSKDNPVQFKILQDDMLKKTVQIEGTINGHPFTQKVSLITGQKQIDFKLNIAWKHNIGIGEYKQTHNWSDNRRSYTDDRYKLKILFPTTLGEEKLYKNAPFDVMESNMEDTFFGHWDQIKNNVILNWVYVTDKNNKYGLAILTDHTSSYIHGKDYPIGLTAQYSGVGLWGMNYSITESLDMNYALIPHQGTWEEAKVTQLNNNWNEPLVAFYQDNIEFSNKIFFENQNEAIEFTSLYWDNGILKARFFNSSKEGNQFKIKNYSSIKSLKEIKLNNDEVRRISLKKDGRGSSFDLSIKPFGLTTIQILKQ